MTITSNRWFTVPRGTLLTDAKFCEDFVEDFVACDRAGEHAESVCGTVQVDENHLLVEVVAERCERVAQRRFAFVYRGELSFVYERRRRFGYGEFLAHQRIETRQQLHHALIGGDADRDLPFRRRREITLRIDDDRLAEPRELGAIIIMHAGRRVDKI